VSVSQPLVLAHPAQQQSKLGRLEGQAETIVGTAANHLLGKLVAGTVRGQHDGGAGLTSVELGENVEAVQALHVQVAEDRVDESRLDERDRARSVARARELNALVRE